MVIKEVHSVEEKNLIKEFLKTQELEYENNITTTLYIEDEKSNIVATISCSNNIIKCLAVRESMQGENYASKLISEIINLFYHKKIYSYLVYTKLKYEDLFLSLGFNKIVSTSRVVIMSSGVTTINDEIKNIRKLVESKFSINLFSQSYISSVVCNCNPVTNGHLHLIEEASKNSSYVIVFLLEEDKSMYTYNERLSLLYIATLFLQNVIVVPSTKYIVSLLTFPTYFLKEESIYNFEWMTTDALIFRDYFMKELNICYRYVGKETNQVMKEYNQTLKSILGDRLIEIERLDNISASKVRALVHEGKIEEAMMDVPQSAKTLFKEISYSKLRKD